MKLPELSACTSLASVEQAALAARNSPTLDDELDAESSEFVADEVELSIDNVDVEYLETAGDSAGNSSNEEEDTTATEDETMQPAGPSHSSTSTSGKVEATRENSVLNPLDNMIGHSLNMTMFLNKLSNAINRARIDAAALEFISTFNKASHRKRLIQHLLTAPYDRLDLLPFYCRCVNFKIVCSSVYMQFVHFRFMATIKPVIQIVPCHVARTILERFREIAARKCTTTKTAQEKSSEAKNTDAKVHLSKYIAEMVSK